MPRALMTSPRPAAWAVGRDHLADRHPRPARQGGNRSATNRPDAAKGRPLCQRNGLSDPTSIKAGRLQLSCMPPSTSDHNFSLLPSLLIDQFHGTFALLSRSFRAFLQAWRAQPVTPPLLIRICYAITQDRPTIPCSNHGDANAGDRRLNPDSTFTRGAHDEHQC